MILDPLAVNMQQYCPHKLRTAESKDRMAAGTFFQADHVENVLTTEYFQTFQSKAD